MGWNSYKDGLDNISTYQKKINKVKESMKGWGANLKGNMKKEKANLILPPTHNTLR
jgi:hypothetical protein